MIAEDFFSISQECLRENCLDRTDKQWAQSETETFWLIYQVL